MSIHHESFDPAAESDSDDEYVEECDVSFCQCEPGLFVVALVILRELVHHSPPQRIAKSLRIWLAPSEVTFSNDRVTFEADDPDLIVCSVK